MRKGSSNTFSFARVATVLAVLSCYGTSVLIGLLSMLGVTLAMDERVWAGTIVFFAALATVAIGVSARHHRAAGPIVIASLGLGLIAGVMYGAFNRIIEITGFVLLIAAALWDWRATTAGWRLTGRACAKAGGAPGKDPPGDHA